MAYGGPAGDPQVTADLNTIRAWQRKLQTGTLDWPLEESVWDRLPDSAFDTGRSWAYTTSQDPGELARMESSALRLAKWRAILHLA
eukprot:2892046-Amphidinium_carterae.2